MKEDKRQIIFTTILCIILIIIYFILSFDNFETSDLKNIIIGLFTGLIITFVFSIWSFRNKLKERLKDNYRQLKSIYAITTYICGTCDEILNLSSVNKTYKFMQRYKNFFENYNFAINNSNSFIFLLDVDTFCKRSNKGRIIEDSKNLYDYIDNVITGIQNYNLLLGELDKIDIQIQMQKELTFDLSIFKEKKRKILDEGDSIVTKLLTDSDRVRTLVFEIFKLYDKENKKYGAVNAAYQINSKKSVKKDYGIKISKEKIKNCILDVINLLESNNYEGLFLLNNYVFDTKTSLHAVINEMELVYDENNEVLNILKEMLIKLDDIYKLNNKFNSKYNYFTLPQYFLDKGIKFDSNTSIESQPEKEKIINELNNIKEVKMIKSISSEILNKIEMTNILFKIDNL